jgi:hypothetical protein
LFDFLRQCYRISKIQIKQQIRDEAMDFQARDTEYKTLPILLFPMSHFCGGLSISASNMIKI